MDSNLNRLRIRELKKRKIYYDFLIEEIDEISKETQDIAKIKESYRSQREKIQELIKLRVEERKLKRGKKVLEWFGIVTVLIGLCFFIYDYQIWKYFDFGFIRKIYRFIVNLPGIVKFLTVTIVAAFSYWSAFRVKSVSLSKLLLLFSTVFFCYDSYQAPIWLLGEEMYRLSLFLVSMVTLYVSYKANFKTLFYLGLFTLSNWFGGATGYETACYWFYMDDPLVFVPFGALLIGLGTLVGKRGKSGFRQPFEVFGCITLFLSLLILSVWGYSLNHEGYWRHGPDISPVWFIILLTVVCALFIWLGIKNERKLFFNFGVTCLVIDLYTRFFEIFSDWLPRSLFWLIFGASVLGVSFFIKKKLFQIQKNFS